MSSIRDPKNAQAKARYNFDDIVCVDAKHKQLIRLARMAAGTSSNILLTGESGTGKELFAQAIHNGSGQASGPFVPLNCASLPRDLIEIELFGYREGAFTGALKGGYSGKIVMAEQGTLFLDEIGDMPFDLQSRLLRVLQERTVLPVGGNKFLPVTFRLIAATNQNLVALLAGNAFRADLYYRLNVVNIQLIPLRDRPDDILPLARHFLDLHTTRLQRRIVGFTTAAEALLQRHSWPGNVRELENAVEFSVNIVNGELIDDCDLPAGIHDVRTKSFASDLAGHTQHSVRPADPAPSPEPVQKDSGASLNMKEHELRLILRVLECHNSNLAKTAHALGIGRTTLYRKLKRHHLEKKSQIISSGHACSEPFPALPDPLNVEMVKAPYKRDGRARRIDDYVRTLAQNEQIRQFVRNVSGADGLPQKLLWMLHSIVERDEQVLCAYIAVARTNQVYGTHTVCYPQNYELPNRTWYREASSRKELIFTPPYFCPLTGWYVATSACPIVESDGTTLAVVAVDASVAVPRDELEHVESE